jgi:hypothetical protein
MRANWVGLAILVAALGCQTGPKKVKRPELVQEYKLPPQEDRRYSQPPQLPTKVLLDDPLARRRELENSAKELQGPMTAGPRGAGGSVGPMP